MADVEIHASPDFFERMLREHPGNVVVLSGRNRGKIDRIVASVNAGLNVLADKPWIFDRTDLPKLERRSPRPTSEESSPTTS